MNANIKLILDNTYGVDIATSNATDLTTRTAMQFVRAGARDVVYDDLEGVFKK